MRDIKDVDRSEGCLRYARDWLAQTSKGLRGGEITFDDNGNLVLFFAKGAEFRMVFKLSEIACRETRTDAWRLPMLGDPAA